MGDALIEIVVEVAAEGLQFLFELWLKGRADRKAAKKIAKKQVKLLKKEHRAQRRLDAKQSRELRKKIRKLKLSDFIEPNNNEVN